jgi:ApbE superfamily uncharacterized protein (UPF0280 family)
MTTGKTRVYRKFQYREALFSICSEHFDIITAEIIRQRTILEEYINTNKKFKISFTPVSVNADAPEVALRMCNAANIVGTGPMAAVAGTMAQLAAEAAIEAGSKEVIIENGGDIFLSIKKPLIMGIYSGISKLNHKLAFSIEPEDTPLAICSSSGRMGHSTSLGNCDLATVVAKDAATADAAATLAANLVKTETDISGALNTIMSLGHISGILLIKNDKIGIAGQLPEIIKTNTEPVA